MTRLYSVSLEWELVVEAETPEDAEECALAAMRDGTECEEPYIHVSPVPIIVRNGERKAVLPGDWDHDCHPWGGSGERTIGQILADERAAHSPEGSEGKKVV